METKRCAVTGKEYVGCVWRGSPRSPLGTVAAEKQMDIGGSEIAEMTLSGEGVGRAAPARSPPFP